MIEFIYIFDLDGTLVNVDDVAHLCNPKDTYQDFDKFHQEAEFCPPDEMIMSYAKAFATFDDAYVYVSTARHEKYRNLSDRWLAKYGIRYDGLLMRQDVSTPAHIVKENNLKSIQDLHIGKNTIYHAFEDDQECIDMYTRNMISYTKGRGWPE